MKNRGAFGFMLVELLVATFIFSIAVAAMASVVETAAPSTMPVRQSNP